MRVDGWTLFVSLFVLFLFFLKQHFYLACADDNLSLSPRVCPVLHVGYW